MKIIRDVFALLFLPTLGFCVGMCFAIFNDPTIEQAAKLNLEIRQFIEKMKKERHHHEKETF